MVFRYDEESRKLTCNQCNSIDITETVIEDFADVEQPVISKDGDLIEYITFSVDAILYTCSKCKSHDYCA